MAYNFFAYGGMLASSMPTFRKQFSKTMRYRGYPTQTQPSGLRGHADIFLFIYLNKLEGDKYKNPVEPTKDETILKDYPDWMNAL